MALHCNRYLDVIAQQLFLGSSIVSYNSNMGWGGSRSSLTVELADDYGCSRYGEISADPNADVFQFSSYNDQVSLYNEDNHYYTCDSDGTCYIDENGDIYDQNRSPNDARGRAPQRPPSKYRIVPGKVYHAVKDNDLVQRYWRKNDPGFFGNATRINNNGVFIPNQLWRYNLINIPVYFRFGYYTFGGVINQWTCNNRIGTPTYSVTINSADDILNNCKVIISKFGGAIFSNFNRPGTIAGGPSNYYGTLASHMGTYRSGNIPNVFNVYGFLESYGFGTSNANDNGIPLAYIIDSLSVLTSTTSPLAIATNSAMNSIWPTYQRMATGNLGAHRAFSPYGRIICPSLMTDSNIDPQNASLGDFGFGIIPPVLDDAGVPRVEFLLDLSELPKPPLDIRYNGVNGVASISDIIGEVCKKTGRDWYTTMIRKNGLNIIKIKTIDRTTSLPSNTIESVVRSIEQSSIPVSTSSFGKEKNNEATPRVMYIGANQQRLYQTKSLLLGYSNTHLVYHPMLKKFVDYYRFGKATTQEIDTFNEVTGKRDKVGFTIQRSEKWVDAFKVPMAYSVRNIAISNYVNTPIVTTLFSHEQSLNNQTSDQGTPVDIAVVDTSTSRMLDENFTDTPIGGFATPFIGNYWPSSNLKINIRVLNREEYAQLLVNQDFWSEEAKEQINCGAAAEGLENTINEKRFIPLWSTAISPFFGYAHDQTIEFSDSGSKSNFYRMIRPVYLDTWTGLLVIGFRPNELPPLSLGLLPNLYATRFGKTGDPTLSDAVGVGMGGGGVAAGAGAAPEAAPAFDPNNPDDPDDPNNPEEEQVNTNGEALSGGTDPFEYNDPGNGLNRIGFVVTETELRAAAVGWESYLHYCLMKLSFSKPDLFVQLVAVYKSEGKLFINSVNGIGLDDTGPGMGGDRHAGAAVNAALGNDAGDWNNPGQEFENLNYNFNWILNHEFINDLKIISEYLRGIYEKFYGKKYIVRVPEISAYRDLQYADIKIPMSQLYDTTVISRLNQQTVRNTIRSVGGNNPEAIVQAIRANYGMNIPEGVIAQEMLSMGIELPEDYEAPEEETDTSNVYQGFGGTGLVDHNTTVAVYQGSGKLFFNYELATDGAWEEPGNFIDDSVLIGGLDYYKLCSSEGKLNAILGYNGNINKDYVAEAWCNLDTPSRNKRWLRATGRSEALANEIEAIQEEITSLERFIAAVGEEPGAENERERLAELNDKLPDLKKKYKWRLSQINQLGRYLNDCSRLSVPSLDLGSIDDAEYVMVNVPDNGREDAFGNRILGKEIILNNKKRTVDTNGPIPSPQNPNAPGERVEEQGPLPIDPSNGREIGGRGYYIAPNNEVIPIPTTKVYFSVDVDGDIIFLDPARLIGPRVILNSPGVNLYFTSMSYQNDPNLTVVNNAVTEDYAILKRMQAGASVSAKQRLFLNQFIRRVSRNMLYRLTDERAKKELLKRLNITLQAIRDGLGIEGAQRQIEERGGPRGITITLADNMFDLTCEEILKEIFNMLETRIIGLRKNPNAVEGDDSTTYVASRGFDDWFLHAQPIKNDVTKTHRMIAPRKANPMFAGVPLKDNTSCYGPWTNYPILAGNRVYPGTLSANRNNIVEQMINNIEVQKDDDLAPWNYGGMSFLDRDIVNKIDSTAVYQMILENGTITTPGSPSFIISNGLHIQLTEFDIHTFNTRSFMGYIYGIVLQPPIFTYAGLVVSSIATSVTERNVSTTYRFDTYSPRLGLFSKENQDRNKEIAKKSIELSQKLASTQRNMEQKILNAVDSIIKSRRSDTANLSGDTAKSDLFGNSPIQMLAGSASYFVGPGGIPVSNDPGCGYDQANIIYDKEKMEEIVTKLENDYNTSSPYKLKRLYTRQSNRTFNWVGAFQTREALAELTYNYQSKAMMSLDGIFSPVSFLPTSNLGTYPISSRFLTQELQNDNVTCPLCLGTKTYAHYDDKDIEHLHPCPLCNKPRIIFPSGESKDILDPPEVNFLSLNPIVVPHGDFVNPNSQLNFNPLERSRHNIRIIGRQESQQVGYNGLDITSNIDNTCDPNTGASIYEHLDAGRGSFDQATSVNPDYYKYDTNYFDPTDSNKKILLNQRFFAFRGPMMLHGWGYDTEGYPVPNRADEPWDFDNEGRPLRFRLTSSGTNDYEQDGAYLPTDEYSLGDIIGTGWIKQNGKWSKQKSRFFHLNWAERSDLWPIGPIDLRWDSERKVWTGGQGCSELDPPFIIASGNYSAGEKQILFNNFANKASSTKKEKCPYKMVYTVLEENLTKIDGIDETYPARGFLDDMEYGLTSFKNESSLINNARKLIYIKDRCGYTAPRGAKLLCRYDKDSGFYEPVTKQQYIVFGNITDGNNAIVDLTYIQGIKAPENIPKINIIFDNTRFNFSLSGKKRGMFMYENGKWILIGTN
jgi:hypothetical protein